MRREPGPGEAARPTPLPADSMGYSLLLAARVIASVHGGKSLSEALLLAVDSGPARAAAQDIAYGVLRQYARGRFFLSRLLTRALTHAETQALLLAAIYRLETRPEQPAMIVDQAVAAAGELAGGVFKGLVNGVLRNFLRQREALVAALPADEEAFYQHPAWWLARLRRSARDRWQEIVAAANSQPPLTLRVNRRRTSVEAYAEQLAVAGIHSRPIGESGLILEKALAVDALPGFADGLVSVQDAGAQRAGELLAPLAGAYVLDACAAPGGKSAHLLERAEIELVALDIDAQRTRRIEENLIRLALPAKVRVADCRDVASWWDGRAFDAILADVPCSGSGVARRHPDIKTLRRESDVRNFARTQAAILDALWPLLKPGGKLLYATCSIFAEENAGQIDAFCARQREAQRLAEEAWLPEHDHDGFFYALLQKTA